MRRSLICRKLTADARAATFHSAVYSVRTTLCHAAGSANDGAGSPQCRTCSAASASYLKDLVPSFVLRLPAFQAQTGSLQPAWRRSTLATFVATRVHRPQVPARTLPGVHSSREGTEVPMHRAGCYFPALRPGPGQSMCSTALPPMRRSSRASIASAGWRQEHSSSTWASRRPPAARAHRRARSLGPLACAVSSPGRSSV